MGLKNIMATIMMGKIEMVLPDIHMINKFMGNCFTGARAISQDFCIYINYCLNALPITAKFRAGLCLIQ